MDQPETAARPGTEHRIVRVDPDGAPQLHILIVRHLVEYELVRQHTRGHVAYLERHHAAGTFVVSGQTMFYPGGVIFASGLDRDAVERLVTEDPYVREGVSQYEILTIELRRLEGAVAAGLLPDGVRIESVLPRSGAGRHG